MTEHSSEKTSTPPVHYRIHIYMDTRPEEGEPVAVSLCPWRRGRNGALTDDIDSVTCSICLHHIREIGLDKIPS